MTTNNRFNRFVQGHLVSLYACLLCAKISNSSKVSGTVVAAVVVAVVAVGMLDAVAGG